jgi:hypothetical protein
VLNLLCLMRTDTLLFRSSSLVCPKVIPTTPTVLEHMPQEGESNVASRGKKRYRQQPSLLPLQVLVFPSSRAGTDAPAPSTAVPLKDTHSPHLTHNTRPARSQATSTYRRSTVLKTRSKPTVPREPDLPHPLS